MLNMAAVFAQQALAISQAYGGPYYDALVMGKGDAIYDDGGSIVTAGTATERACQAQVDDATQDMRREEGFTDGDVRIIILSDTLAGSIGLDDSVKILGGPHMGEWLVQTISRDAFGIYFELRGRRA